MAVASERRSFREAYTRLAAAQKGRARGAPGYSLYVNRPFGRVLAAIAYTAGLTPNAVTAVSAVHTFLAIALLIVLPAGWWTGVIVALLLAVGYAWDSADGQVARLTGTGSPAGEWLDHFVDAIKIASLHLAVLVALWWHTPARDSAWLVVPIVFSIVATVTFFGMLLNDLIKSTRSTPSAHETGGSTPLRAIVLLPTDFGALCIVFVLWGSNMVFLIAYGLLALAATGFLCLAAVKWYRDMTRL